MNRYIPELDGRAFAIAAVAVAGSAVLSYLLRDVPSGVLQNLLAVVFLGGPLAALFVYFAAQLSDQD
jgi:hypothetical protein